MKNVILSVIALFAAVTSTAAPDKPSASATEGAETADSLLRVREVWEIDQWLDTTYVDTRAEGIAPINLPRIFFMPAVYNTYIAPDTTYFLDPDYSGVEGMEWIETEMANDRRIKAIQYDLFYNHPEIVRYNVALLPEAPKRFHAVIDPTEHKIEIGQLKVNADASETLSEQLVERRHWIRAFSASLQFSQAYISPNWYQGGNNNLNMLAQLFYNVKLNTKYHPNLLFETTAQYKLGMNNAPDDSIHGYNISDDLLQVNTTFGIRALKHWYYSFTGQFKTQLFNSYAANSRELRSAFMSPGELTAGIGMTYNWANAKKSFTIDASLAPLSYSLKTCINTEINPQKYNIKEGRKTLHSFGSSAEVRAFVRLAWNITWSSRLFAFTDYDTAQADWENRFNFEINRFLATQINIHARYDSSTSRDGDWHKLQLKEVISVGLSYKFSTI